MEQIRSKVEVLDPEEIALVHNGSLRLLERTGMRVPNREVRGLAAALGALVDDNTGVVRIPSAVMEDLLDTVRHTDCEATKPSDTVTKLTGNVSTQIFMVDDRTGERRYGTMNDLMDGIALVQGLPNIPLANAVVVPSDVDPRLSDVYSYHAIYKYSQKPGGTYVLTPRSAKYIIEMSEAMHRPVSYLFDTVSPLSVTENSLEIALIFREHDLELAMTPMVMAGSTGPISLAGLITLQNAEALGSLFFIYAITGKIPKYVASGHTSDVRHNMFCSFGSPNQALIGIATAQMARYYGLKSGSNAGLTDAIRPDFQCGFEKGLTAAVSMLAGTEAIGGQGIVGADQGMSFAQLVLDNEWIDAFNYVRRGFEVSEDSIGLETIEEVGIGGNFLGEEHTVDYMRQSGWAGTLFPRGNFDEMSQEDLLARAHARAEDLIAKHRTDTPVVDDDQARQLDEILARAVSETQN